MLNEFTHPKACIKYWSRFLGDSNFKEYFGLSYFESINNFNN